VLMLDDRPQARGAGGACGVAATRRNEIIRSNGAIVSGVRAGFALVLVWAVAAAAVLATGALARSSEPHPARRANVYGWVIFAGGQPAPRRVGSLRRGGIVIVRTARGRVVLKVRATAEHGFRLSLMPGRYELSVASVRGGHLDVSSCPRETRVALRAGRNPAVDLYVGCESLLNR
jgi:anti-sigma factor RsiW